MEQSGRQGATLLPASGCAESLASALLAVVAAGNGSADAVGKPKYVPLVRLGAMWEGAMPDNPSWAKARNSSLDLSVGIDAAWAQALDETVAILKQ